MSNWAKSKSFPPSFQSVIIIMLVHFSSDYLLENKRNEAESEYFSASLRLLHPFWRPFATSTEKKSMFDTSISIPLSLTAKKTHQFELLWLRYNNYVLGATTYATALWDGKFIETTFCALPGASVWKHIHWHISWACEYISSPTDRVYYTHFKAPKGRSSIFSLTSCSSDPQNPNSFFFWHFH